jgi:hypothetical protein
LLVNRVAGALPQYGADLPQFQVQQRASGKLNLQALAFGFEFQGGDVFGERYIVRVPHFCRAETLRQGESRIELHRVA